MAPLFPLGLLLLSCADPEPAPPPAPQPAPAPASVPTVAVAIAPPAAIRPLVAEATAQDPLGRPVALTWAWEVDGAPAPWDGPVVPAHALHPDETWTVTVTARTDDGRTATGSASAVVPAPAGGNVLMVVLDDLGVDKFNAYRREERMHTPSLDRLAREGVFFTNAYASPICSPTRAQLLTGRHARRTGVGELVAESSADALPEAAITLPEALDLARAGPYTTVAVGKYHLAGMASSQGLQGPNLQGFDWFSGSYANLPELPDGYYRWIEVVNGVAEPREVYATTDTVDDALARLGQTPEPWFLYVAFNAPHTPYHLPPEELLSEPVGPDPTVPRLHAAMLEALDTELGRLLAGIPPAVRARTTIVVIGDNGTGKLAVVPPLLPERSKHTVYEGGVHVPLVVAGPLVTQPGARCEALVHAVDVFTTVADLAGVPLAPREGGGLALDLGPDGERLLDGVSLLPWIADPALPSPRETLMVETFGPNGPPPYHKEQLSIRDARYKLVRRMRDGVGESTELYDLAFRPWDEGEDLVARGLTPEQQAAFDRLSAALDEQLAAMPYEGF